MNTKKRYLRVMFLPIVPVLLFIFVQFALAGKDAGWLLAAIGIALQPWSVWALLIYCFYLVFGREKHVDLES